MRGTPGVREVHDLHVWTITSGMVSMSGHVVVDGTVAPHDLLATLATSLRVRFGIAHTTIQIEGEECAAEALHP
jgi:cobalt-zinc-cadmium efflux system protein